MFTGTTALLVLCAVVPLVVVQVVDATVSYREITVINKCYETVRVGRTGGQCLPKNDTIYGPTGCPVQMALNPANNQCYWDIPNFGNGTDLQPGANVTILIPGLEFTCTSGELSGGNPVKVTWSGNLWGATGCKPGKPCETGLCFFGPNDARNGYCPSYQGPKGPLTRAEFTFQNTGDFYDITALDGVNVPVEMRSNTPTLATLFGQSGVNAYYWCANPGGIETTNLNLSDCSWAYDIQSIGGYGDQSVNLTLVAKNTTNMDCTRDTECPSGEYCGVLQDLNEYGGPGPRLFPGKCGKLIGIWTSSAICSWSSGLSTANEFPNIEPFRCMTRTEQNSGTFSDLFRCTAPYAISGYTSLTGGQQCNSMDICGCSDWVDSGIMAPATSPCVCNNTVWKEKALPWLKPMKKACPTSYTYPFDDKSSTFRCANNLVGNSMDYTITFCPGGRSISRPRQLALPDLPDNGGVMMKYSPSIVILVLVAALFL